MLLEMGQTQFFKLLHALPGDRPRSFYRRVLAEIIERMQVDHAYPGDQCVDLDQGFFCGLQH